MRNASDLLGYHSRLMMMIVGSKPRPEKMDESRPLIWMGQAGNVESNARAQLNSSWIKLVGREGECQTGSSSR